MKSWGTRSCVLGSDCLSIIIAVGSWLFDPSSPHFARLIQYGERWAFSAHCQWVDGRSLGPHLTQRGQVAAVLQTDKLGPETHQRFLSQRETPLPQQGFPIGSFPLGGLAYSGTLWRICSRSRKLERQVAIVRSTTRNRISGIWTCGVDFD